MSTDPTAPDTTAPDTTTPDASVSRRDARLEELLETPAPDVGALMTLLNALTELERGSVFGRLRERLGPDEASRIWLAVFAASDAAPT